MAIPWAGRLATIGATVNEIVAIQAAHDASVENIKHAVNDLIEGIDNDGLLQMLTAWRGGSGPFASGYPGAGLPFGTHAAMLTGNSADDTKVISAGTGQALTLAAFTGTIDGGTP